MFKFIRHSAILAGAIFLSQTAQASEWTPKLTVEFVEVQPNSTWMISTRNPIDNQQHIFKCRINSSVSFNNQKGVDGCARIAMTGLTAGRQIRFKATTTTWTSTSCLWGSACDVELARMY